LGAAGAQWALEEGPDSAGQAARRKPRGGDPWKVPQRTDRRSGSGAHVPGRHGGKGETVG